MTIQEPLLLFSVCDPLTSGQIESLKSLCHQEGLVDQHVAVISISGRFRQGKSFLLNLFARYLRASGRSNWLVDGQKPNSEFSWGSSRNPITKGVLLYPEVFSAKSKSGENIAVLLIDSQGIFDADTTMADNTSIFAFTMLLSSKQIVNSKKNISGDDLTSLELFSQFGKMLANVTNRALTKPFQDLVFLVRDWIHADQLPYGWEGGRMLFNERFNSISGKKEELKQVRDNIKDCFESFECFLMPYPGDHVNQSKQFTNNPKDIKPEFLEQIVIFFDSILKNLEPKKIGGNFLSLGQFVATVESFEQAIKSDAIPKPETLFEAMKQISVYNLCQECAKIYDNAMNSQIAAGPLEEKEFLALHNKKMDDVRTFFENYVKIGPAEQWKRVGEGLIKSMNDKFATFRRMNQSKLAEKVLWEQMQCLQKKLDEARELSNRSAEQVQQMLEQMLKLEDEKRDIQQQLKESQEEVERKNALLKAQAKKSKCNIL